MRRIGEIARFVLENFGPIIAFYVGQAIGGLLVGIAAATVFAVVECIVRVVKREKLTQLFVLTTTLTIGLGLVDLFIGKSVVFQYEACVTNVLVGSYFGASLLGDKPIIGELYEKTRKSDEPLEPGVVSYLRLLTGVWTGYFFVKAALYGWVAARFPLDRAMAIRSVVGTASFVVLIAGERLLRKPIFRKMTEWGWIGERFDPPRSL